MVPGWGREPFCGDCRITSKRRMAIAWEVVRKSVASTCPCRRRLASMCWYACNTTDSGRKRPWRLRLNWGLRRASRYLWRLARKVSGSGVRACEHWTAGRRLSSTWITKQSWMAISVIVSMRLPFRKRREDVTYAPCVTGVSPGRQAALHGSGAHECSTPRRQAELQICSAWYSTTVEDLTAARFPSTLPLLEFFVLLLGGE